MPVTERHTSASVISFWISHLYNGAPLACRVRMKTLALLLTLLSCATLPAAAQETDAPDGVVIESATVSGIDFDQLSPGLRRDISALDGTPLDRAKAGALATRIEEELPEMVAAVRAVSRPGGGARVVFLVARISDDTSVADNINSRYVVETVETSGVPDTDVPQDLRDRLQALTGKPLRSRDADALSDELRAAFPRYEVKRRISRGSVRGRIRVVFELTLIDTSWVRFTPSRSKFVFHDEQKFSGVLDVPMGSRNHRVGVVGVFTNRDDLVEEYSGFRLRLESRRLATERVGAAIEFSRFTQEWQDVTLAALAADPTLPEAYRTRITIEPTVTFAVSPYVRVFGGASVSDLESLSASPASTNAHAWLFGVGADRQWRAGAAKQRVEGSYRLRAGVESLGSDLDYTRHAGDVRVRMDHGHSTLLASLSLGYISGQPPLFERFTLGDTSTLRGWNKFDIAPAGGDRMWHQSLEYRFYAGAVFLDAGSVWDHSAQQRARLSAGFGIHVDNFFLLGGFPLNADNGGGIFMVGVRF